MTQAEALAKAGEFALGLLASQKMRTAKRAATTIRAASLIGGDEALELIRRCSDRHDTRMVRAELLRAWNRFEPDTYAREILAKTHFHASLNIRDPRRLPALKYIQPIHLNLSFPQGYGDISSLRYLESLSRLEINDWKLSDLSPLIDCPELEYLGLDGPPMHNYSLRSLNGCLSLTRLEIKYSACTHLDGLVHLDNLTELQISAQGSFTAIQNLLPPNAHLRRFGMWQATGITNVRGICADPRLAELTFLLLGNCKRLYGITGIEQLANTLAGIYLHAPKVLDYQILANLPKLEFMNISQVPVSDLSFIQNLRNLRIVHLGGMVPLPDLAPLLQLPGLTDLFLYGNDEIDLAPLAEKKNLSIHIYPHVKIYGAANLGQNSKVVPFPGTTVLSR